MKKIALIFLCLLLCICSIQAQNILMNKLKSCIGSKLSDPITLTWGFEEEGYTGSIPPTNQDFKNPALINKLIESSWINEDSVVLEVFKRNFYKWDSTIIVMDWTGSMYPYGLQVLIWLEMNQIYQNNVQGVVLFNDGNRKDNAEKVIGRTGGIYFSSLANTSQAMALVAQNGAGGDLPENDLEAMLGGMDKCPECKNLILIADSQSMVRDLELIYKFTKYFPDVKVHSILCGVKNNDDFVVDYLTMASFTNGSVHTIEQDLENLGKLKKKNVIRIENKKYRLKNGVWQSWYVKKR